MFIYLLVNTVNGKYYVGQTVRPVETRLRQHLTVANAGTRGMPVSFAIKKYGWENFDSYVLEECDDQDQLNISEAYWIESLNCLAPLGYNLRLGGANGKMSEITKAKLRIKSTGRRLSSEAKAKIAKARTGSSASAESKQKMSDSHAGEKGSLAKLSWEKVGEIRSRRLMGETTVSLAKTFDVSADCISNITRGDTWKLEGIETTKQERKMTMEMAQEIRDKRLEGETGASLSRQYGVSQALVSKIVNGQKWIKAELALG